MESKVRKRRRELKMGRVLGRRAAAAAVLLVF